MSILVRYFFILCLIFMSSNSFANRLIPGQIIIKLKKNASNKSSTLVQNYGAQVVSKLRNKNSNVSLLSFPTKSLDMSEVVEELRNDPDVEWAEQNFYPDIKFDVTKKYIIFEQILTKNKENKHISNTNDVLFGQQWAIRNFGNRDNQEDQSNVDIDIARLNAKELNVKRVKIAVIDTGVDYLHEDLHQSMWVNKAERDGLDGVDDDGNGYVDDVYGYDFTRDVGDPMDDDGHGTHVAGIIGATQDNGKGITGVLNKVDIIALKILKANREGAADAFRIAKSIEYAVDNGASIINCSWGGSGSSYVIEGAFRYAGRKNVIVVAAAGNDGKETDEPGSFHYPSGHDLPNIISIGNHTSQNTKSSTSNYGRRSVDIFAPGESIVSTYPTKLAKKENMSNPYISLSGTSMAAPYVSGVLGLYIAYHENYNAEKLIKLAMDTSTSVEAFENISVSGGRISAYQLVKEKLNFKKYWKTYNITNIDNGDLWTSEHDYQSNFDHNYILTVPGAKYIKYIIENFDTEKKLDVLSLYSDESEVIQQFSGYGTNLKTDYIKGQKIAFNFKTDGSAEHWGYEIKKVEIIEEFSDVPESEWLEYQLPQAFETEHDYSNSITKEQVISLPGVKAIKVIADRISLEEYKDNLKIYDKNNKLYWRYNGECRNCESRIIPGDQIKLVFNSDQTIVKWGAKISKVKILGAGGEFKAFMAYQNGDIESIKNLVKMGFDINTYYDFNLGDKTYKRTLAQQAIIDEKFSLFTELSRLNGFNSNLRTSNDYSYLDLLSDKKQFDILATLETFFTDFGLKINVNEQDQDGYTPAMLAARNGSSFILGILGREGADFSLSTKDGLTALHIAAKNEKDLAVDFLLNYLNVVEKINQQQISTGLTPLINAAQAGCSKCIEYLMSKAELDLNIKAKDGSTALSKILEKREDVAITQEIIKKFFLDGRLDISDFLNNEDFLGMSYENLTFEEFKILFEKGINPNLNYEGQHFIVHPFVYKKMEYFNYLANLQNIDLDIIVNDRFPLVFLPVIQKDFELFSDLLKIKNINLNAVYGEKNQGLLSYLIENDQYDFAKLIVQDERIEVNKRDLKGYNAIDISISVAPSPDSFGIFKKLLQRKDVDVNSQDSGGWNALILSANQNRLEFVQHILTLKGVMKNLQSIKTGETALHKALAKNYTQVSLELINAGVNLDIANVAGDRALHTAVLSAGLVEVRSLINAGSNINTLGSNGRSPLMMALELNKLDIVNFLVDLSPAMNNKTQGGDTPLHIAIRLGNIQLVEKMCNKGADPRIENARGQNGVDLADDLGNKDIKKFLKKFVRNL